MKSFIDEFYRIISNYGFDEGQLNIIKSVLEIVVSRYDVIEKNCNLNNYSLLDLYIQCKKLEGRSQCTLDNYKGTVQWLLNYLNKEPDKVTSNDIRLFLIMIKNGGRHCDRSIDKFREYIQHFYRWLMAEGLISTDPTLNVHKIKYSIKDVQPLTDEELESLRDHCYDFRSRAIVETLYSTGCRVSELINMKVSDIDLDNNSIEVLGKGRKYRTVYLTELAKNSIVNYLNSRNDNSEYLFSSYRTDSGHLNKETIEKIIGGISSYAGISKKVTPHVLRHTFATLALRRGMDITIISKILGHSNISTTMIYANIDNTDIKKAHMMYVR